MGKLLVEARFAGQGGTGTAMNFRISAPKLRPIAMPSRLSSRPAPRGFTLIEMMVALAITLIMMGAVVTLFGVISDSVSASRSAIEMSDRLRAARNILQEDLAGATATMSPPLRPANDEGYFEIIEGPATDAVNEIEDGTFGNADDHLLLFGDTDDVLMFTVRRREPFVGKTSAPAGIIESPCAEVIYFLAQDPNSPPRIFDATTATPTRLCTLYRRVLLVAPGVGSIVPFDHFYDEYDLSVRFQAGPPPTLIPNTLGDLTKRENRFAHYADAGDTYGKFPFLVNVRGIPIIPTGWPPVDTSSPAPGSWPPERTPIENAFLAPLGHERLGDDVLLTNVLAFDVQVWDPGAPVQEDSGVALEPSDPGWQPGAATVIGYGAYVDLGYSLGLASPAPPLPAPVFSEINPDRWPRMPASASFPSTQTESRVYDTWSLHYENDGINNADGTPGGDLATNGLDDTPMGDPGFGVVDDITEYDTLPPYRAPLRGIRVTIRIYEPDSKQVREAVVVQDFLPE